MAGRDLTAVVATRPSVAVTTAAERAARDADAIAAGVPSRALMRAAGLAAAAECSRRYRPRLSGGVAVFTGPGNNGGDAWVVAGALAAAGVTVRVHEAAPARTPEADAERARALPLIGTEAPHGDEALVVDGLLGTGARPVHDGPIAAAIARIGTARAGGAAVIALDLPSGLGADDGTAAAVVRADLTCCFGSIPRGVLLRRDLAGAIACLDIGLGGSATLPDRAAVLVDAAWVRRVLPPIPPSAHKGTRGTLAIVGGGPGMAGAAVLAARAALASGLGLADVRADPSSVPALLAAVPAALCGPWPSDDAVARLAFDRADALVVGPGLGRDNGGLVARVLGATAVPVVLDADALNAFAGRLGALAALARGRAVLTPHPGEAGRLLGWPTADVTARPFDAAQALADATGTVTLLKGVPTVVAVPGGPSLVAARGTPALATGGSGDVLAGVLGALLAQGMPAADAAAAAAWVHGIAAELAGEAGEPGVAGDAGVSGDAGPIGARVGRVRGVTLADVMSTLPSVWALEAPPPMLPVLAELPDVSS